MTETLRAIERRIGQCMVADAKIERCILESGAAARGAGVLAAVA
jgi:hypothetical protein